MRQKMIERSVGVVFSSGGTLYVNGQFQRGICNSWIGLLVYGKVPTAMPSGVWNVTFRRGPLPSWKKYDEGWQRGEISRGKRMMYAHTIGRDDGFYRRGRVPRGPVAVALRALLGTSPKAVIWFKAQVVSVGDGA